MDPPKNPRVEGRGGSSPNRCCVLPRDLLGLIARRLGFLELVRFGGVCTTWRSAALEERRRRRRRGDPVSLRLPTLLVHRQAPRGTEIGFFSTWRRGFLDLDLPGAFFSGAAARCCGSSWGWLAIVDDANFDICLVDPVTRARVQLPSRSRFPFRSLVTPREGHRDPVRYLKKVILSSNPASSGCTVAAIGRSNLLALCRPGCGDDSWAVFVGKHSGGYEDVAFHGDQLCALDFFGRLTVCSLAASVPGVTNFAVVDLDPCPPPLRLRRRLHLVGSSGELLMVVINYYPGKELRVFKLGMNGWDPVQSLGERMLFVGEINSESMSADGAAEIPGFKANTICLTRRPELRATSHTGGSFCIETGCAIPVTAVDPDLLLEEPVWVMAALW